MTTLELAALRQLISRVLTHQAQAGSATGSAAVAAAARGAYDDLARVLIPLIGPVGTEALTARAVHLAQREYLWLAKTRDPKHAQGPFTHVSFSLEHQDPALAAEGAAAVLVAFVGLLITFIGEPLTTRLMRKAWPDGFSDAGAKETCA